MNRAAVFAAALACFVAACEEKPAPTTSSSSEAPSATAAASEAPVAVASSAPEPPSEAPSAAPSASAAAKEPEEVIVQHILISYKGAPRIRKKLTRTKAEAKALAEEVLVKARAGEDFTALVRQYSDDPEAITRMGSLGKIRRDDMVKPFSDAAFALKMGQISDVVETRFGYHIIKRNQ